MCGASFPCITPCGCGSKSVSLPLARRMTEINVTLDDVRTPLPVCGRPIRVAMATASDADTLGCSLGHCWLHSAQSCLQRCFAANNIAIEYSYGA